LKILSLRELIRYHEDMVIRAFALMDSVQLLLVIVTIAGIFDLLLSVIIESRRELALWRLIGASDPTVRRSVVLGSVTIGVLGALLGMVVGAITAWIWVSINFRYLLGYYLRFHFAWAVTARFVALVVCTTIISGWSAARYAVRQSLLEGLRCRS
jgi:putative ABC transport system permease protein